MSIKSMGNFVLELLFPSTCLGCGVSGEILCPNCVIKASRTDRETSKSVFAVFQYHDPIIKKAIWDLKYHKVPYLGQRLGEILYEELLEDISDIKAYSEGIPILVIPVPISKNKNKKRGYNQAEKIARGLCKKADKKIFLLKSNIVKKKEDTIPQARITNRARRLKNIKDSFKLKNKKIVRGKTIIIIDDVTTTGGTINEITKLLKQAGAKKVIGFAVAH